MAGRLLLDLHGLNTEAEKIQNGFIYAVDDIATNNYLNSPLVIPAGNQPLGIWEIKNGKPARFFERRISNKGDTLGSDACLIARGQVTARQGKRLQVLIIAGHSRYSTMDGVLFALSNQAWAEEVNKLEYTGSETVISVSTSITHGRVIKLAQPPRLIKPISKREKNNG